MHKQVIYILTAVVLLFLETVNAQGHLISGTIVDAQGISLPGVTVLEQDSANGVVSDLNGNYILTTSSSNATLKMKLLKYNFRLNRRPHH